jgi:N-acetylglucosaminyl-diphospho-decaprenol L-rhamnosyltransferase
MTATLDIIIVNWNSGRYLRQCLESIADCSLCRWELRRVVVIDNASTDASIEGVETLNLPLVLTVNPVNRGFAAACNQGARECKSDYLLFLNPDTRVFRNTLDKTIHFMEESGNSMVGICGVRIVGDSGVTAASCARFPTLTMFLGRMTGLSWVAPRFFPPHILGPQECQLNRQVDQIIGAFFLVRTKLFLELGGFDERFFVYFEEVDFSLRARKYGFSSYLLADTVAFHKGCVSSDQVKSRRLFYSLRSRFQYGFKHFSRLKAWGLVVLTFTVEFPARILAAVLAFSWAGLFETVSAYGQLVAYYFNAVAR